MINDKIIRIVINATDNASKQISKMGASVEQSLKKVGIAAGIAAAAIGGAVYKATKDVADAAEKIDILTKATGLSAESASALGMAAMDLGIDVNDVAMGVKKMEIALNNATDKGSKTKEVLKSIGLNLKDLESLKPEEQFVKIGNAIASTADEGVRMTASTLLLGRSGSNLIAMFKEGKLSLEDLMTATRNAGLMFDEVSLKKALGLDDAFDKLNESIKGVWRQFALAMAPAMEKFLKQIQPVVQSVMEWVKANPELTAQIITTTLAILGALAVLPAFISGLGAVGVAIGFLVSPVGLVVAAIVGLTAYLVNLYMTNEDFRVKVTEIWNQVYTAISQVVEWLKQKWIELTPVIQKLWADMQGYAQIAMDWYNAVFLPVFAGWASSINTIMENLRTWLQNHWVQIQAVWEMTMTALRLAWDGLWLLIRTGFEVAWAIIRGVITIALDVFKGDWKGAQDAWTLMWQEYWAALTPLFNAAWEIINTAIANAWTALQGTFTAVKDACAKIWNEFWAGLSATVTSTVNTMCGTIDRIHTAISNALSAVANFASGKIGYGTPTVTSGVGIGKAKASGGPVQAGEGYLVGEEGPEYFMPTQSGYIFPHSRPVNAGVGGTNVTVNIMNNEFFGEEGIAERVGDRLMKVIKQTIRV